MDLVSKPHSSALVCEHFGFKPIESRKPIDEPVGGPCLKKVIGLHRNIMNTGQIKGNEVVSLDM